MRDRLIHFLGGYTDKDYTNSHALCENTFKDMMNTIRELQALVPVSAVLPKKRGRPRKYAKAE